MALLFAGDAILPGHHLFRWDTLVYNYPLWQDMQSQFLVGRLPLWCDAINGGTPLLGNINAGVLYPVRWPFFLLPLETGYAFFLFLHVWFSFVAMHVCLRAGWRLPGAASLAGALVYGACGYARSMWDTHNFIALPWIPAAVACVLAGARSGRPRAWTVAGAACFAMLVLGGDVQAAVVWIPVGLLAALASRRPRRGLAVWGLTLGLGLMLSAPQWLCTMLYLPESMRAGGLSFDEAARRSFHPVRLFEAVLPYLFGNRDEWLGADLTPSGVAAAQPWVSSFHAGMLALAGFVIAWTGRRRKLLWFSGLVAVFSAAAAFGPFLDPVFDLLRRLPVLNGFRYPEKYLLWLSFAWATAAAAGLHRLLGLYRSRSLRSRFLRTMLRLAALWLAFAAIACWCAVSIGGRRWDWGAFAENVLPRPMLVWTLALVLAVWRERPSIHAPVVLLAADLFVFWRVEHPVTTRFDPLDPPALVQCIQAADPAGEGVFLADPELTRFPVPPDMLDWRASERAAVNLLGALKFNAPMLWGLKTSAGFSPLESSAMVDFRESKLGRATGGGPAFAADVLSYARRTGVKWLATSLPRLREMYGTNALPRVEAAWGEEGDVVLADLAPAAPLYVQPFRGGAESLPVIRETWSPRSGFLRVDLSPGERVMLDLNIPASTGWTARDGEGNPLELCRLDSPFAAVDVPAGTTQVRLSYSPPGLRRGFLLCAAGLLGCLLLIIRGRSPIPVRRILTSRFAIATCCAGLFLVAGRTAQRDWSPTFDECYHTARGLAWIETGDARLSRFHPPLQNAVCAYFARLAYGHRMVVPQADGWNRSDIHAQTSEWVGLHGQNVPEILRAARNGSALFGLLLVTVLCFWAFRLAGAPAAWMAGIAAACSPSILAHGNLVTTDIGVTALALAGTFAVWSASIAPVARALVSATACFALAALVKFTGLIWFGVFAFVALPALAIRWRRGWIMAYLPLGLLLLGVGLLALYGPESRFVKAPGTWWDGRVLPFATYLEGLMVQGGHVLEGHRSFLCGEQLARAPLWAGAFTLAIKTPIPWLAAIALSPWIFFARHRDRFVTWAITLLPAAVFALLAVGVNRASLGIRHLLPLLALALLAASVAVSRLSHARGRAAAIAILAGTSLFEAVSGFPDYIGHYPLWASGAGRGREWMVDSQFDWGQNLERLEADWDRLSSGPAGPPRLAYYGFIDPRLVYRLSVSQPSLCGAMHVRGIMARGPDVYDGWRAAVIQTGGFTVMSASVRRVDPWGLDFGAFRALEPVAQAARSFEIFLDRPRAGKGP